MGFRRTGAPVGWERGGDGGHGRGYPTGAGWPGSPRPPAGNAQKRPDAAFFGSKACLAAGRKGDAGKGRRMVTFKLISQGVNELYFVSVLNIAKIHAQSYADLTRAMVLFSGFRAKGEFTQRRKGGAQRAQRNTRTPCGLRVSFAPFA